jgi:hypothetical protein
MCSMHIKAQEKVKITNKERYGKESWDPIDFRIDKLIIGEVDWNLGDFMFIVTCCSHE